MYKLCKQYVFDILYALYSDLKQYSFRWALIATGTLLTKKHLYNIEQTYNLNSNLKLEYFVLIIMNEGQMKMLENYGSDCVCIDGTHGLNNYGFELYTLLVLDDIREGFPAALLISNRSDQEIMSIFFSIIKQRLAIEIHPKVFMSGMADCYYNASVRVTQPVEFRYVIKLVKIHIKYFIFVLFSHLLGSIVPAMLIVPGRRKKN